MCDISVMMPDEELARPLANALQLLPDPGHANQDGNNTVFLPSSGLLTGNIYYPTEELLPRASRPQLAQVTTTSAHSSPYLSQDGYLLSACELKSSAGNRSSNDFPNLHLSDWAYIQESFKGPNSPSFHQGSPISQGYSPITPITPLLSMGPSPTASTFPSPGSQGNSELLQLAPSPHSTFPIPLPTVDIPAGPVHRYAANPLQLDGQSSTVPYELSVGLTGITPATFDLGSRRQSQSTSGPTRPVLTSSSTSSPYARPSQCLPAVPSSRGRSASEASASSTIYMYGGLPIPGPIVRQLTYRPVSQSDHRRYVKDIKLHNPIYFYQKNPQELGIDLDDLHKNRLARLEGRDEYMFEGQGPSISIRIVWEGYGPWSRQIPTKDFKTPPNPITKERLAIHVARTVNRFINEMSNQPMQAGSDIRWKIGTNGIGLLDLKLLSLHHVSKGSWQVNLCLNHPLS